MKRVLGTLGMLGQAFYFPPDCIHFLLPLLLLFPLDLTNTSPERPRLQSEPCGGEKGEIRFLTDSFNELKIKF